MKYFFILQFQRKKREFINLGLNPYVGIALYLIVFIACSFLIFQRLKNAPYIYPFLALFFIMQLSNIQRIDFLKSSYLRIEYLKLRLVEHVLNVLPFCIFLMYKNHYLIALTTLAIGTSFPFYNKVWRTSFQIPSPFSKKPFEFTIGFRRSLPFVIAVYIISYIGIYYHNFSLELFCLLCIFLICLTYYSPPDPIFYVWIHAYSAKEFVLAKIKIGLRYGFLLSLPSLIPIIFFNPSGLWEVALVLIIGMLYILLSVSATYANFPMENTLSQSFQMYLAIFIPPFLLLIIPNLFLQAVNRLKPFLKC